MKVALYHNLPSGGALRVLSEYVRARRREHEFELFAPTSASDFFGIGGFVPTQWIEVPGGTGLLADYRKLRAVPRFGREAARRIDAGGFDAVLATASFLTQAPEVLPYLRTPSLYFCPEPLRGVYEKEREPFTANPKTAAKRAVRAAYDRRRVRFDRRAVRKATAVAVNSKYTRRNVRKVYGVASDVVRHGVDTKAFRPGRTAREPFVLSVGALHPLKGHQFVIEALGLLERSARPRLVVIGDRGDYGPELARLAREGGVRLQIRKGVSDAELKKAYREASVFAAAQVREPFGLITLEAMASGTPVVAVDEAGLAETVRNGKNGLQVPRDARRFADAIGRVLGDLKLAKRLAEAGRRDVERNWRWDAAAEDFDRLLAKVARKSR